jgi:hypothetical protein
MSSLSAFFCFLIFWLPAQSPSLSGTVKDETNQPVAAVNIVLRGESGTFQAVTNELGEFHFDGIGPGDYRLDLDKAGFFRLGDYHVTVSAVPTEIAITMNHEYEMHSAIDVVSNAHEIVPEQTRHEDEIVAHEIREDPTPSSHSLQNSLPALPGVVQDNNGVLHVAGGRIENTSYTLDGFDLSNPATGWFDARLNVDAVRAVDVSSGRYGADDAGSAVLSLQTDSGDDHWRFGTTNFLPSFTLQGGTHLGNWFPRMTVSGPLQKGRAWFFDGVSLQHNYTLISEQPAGSNTSEQWSEDNLLRLQYNLTPAQSLQWNFLFNGSNATRSGLGPFSPASTTTNGRSRRYFLSIKDQIAFERGLFEFGGAYDRDRDRRIPQGTQTYVLTPSGPQGNYFESLSRNARRWQGHAALTLIGKSSPGSHNIQMGASLENLLLDQTAIRQSIEVRQSDSTLVRSSSFYGGPRLSVSETHVGAYLQDAWRVRHSLVVNSSLRVERNDFIGRTVPQPRVVLSWTPQSGANKFSAGWGIYYEPVFPSVIAQLHDQQRVDVFTGSTLSVNFSRQPTLRQPYFETASLEWQHQWNAATTASVQFTNRNERHGLNFANVSTDSSHQDLVLNDGRRDRYHAIEGSVQRSFQKGEMSLDYMYSRARSNRVFDYTITDFLLAPQSSGPLTWDTPHRLISHGAVQTNIWNLLFSYFGEYHTGFAFSAVDSTYQLAGVPNGYRYPAYFSLNIGAEKRFRFFHYEWAVRLSAINVTAHHNDNAVINNADASNFLEFSGGQHRAFTARLRLVGRK